MQQNITLAYYINKNGRIQRLESRSPEQAEIECLYQNVIDMYVIDQISQAFCEDRRNSQKFMSYIKA